MRLLFDTHAFIWWDGEQSKLSGAVLDVCQLSRNSLHLSLASVWELQIKMQLGKLALRLPLADVLRDQQQQNGLVLEPVTLEDILALSQLPLPSRPVRSPHNRPGCRACAQFWHPAYCCHLTGNKPQPEFYCQIVANLGFVIIRFRSLWCVTSRGRIIFA